MSGVNLDRRELIVGAGALAAAACGDGELVAAVAAVDLQFLYA